MSLFEIFSKSRRTAKANKPQIEYGFRGEGITYRKAGRETEIEFTWIDGQRIYTETIISWKDGIPISESEKPGILVDILQFTRGWFRKTIVVINTDDPSCLIWKDVCDRHKDLVESIEYTSNEENRRAEREMYVGVLNSKGGLVINDVKITNEAELDEVLNSLEEKRNRLRQNAYP